MKIEPKRSIRGEIRLNGDKSISHRAAIIAALANGKSRIGNFSRSDDCSATLSCLEQLGVEISRGENFIEVHGKGKRGFRKPIEALDCRNSGTTMRLLAGLLAGQEFDSILVGDPSLSMRPMKRIAEPLRSMGAQIETENDHAPIRIHGNNPLAALNHRLDVSSAQVKSCLLFAALYGNGVTTIQNPLTQQPFPASRDHTERLLRLFGATVGESFSREDKAYSQMISLDGGTELAPATVEIPGDVSSAAFFIVAASILENSELKISEVGLNPTRIRILNVLNSAGAQIRISNLREVSNEPRGDLHSTSRLPNVTGNETKVIRGEETALIIDEIPALAVFATQIRGGMEFRNAQELRRKESDRIKAIVENLKAMNAQVEEFEDGFRVSESKLRGARLQSFGDHRIAMAFTIAALFAEGESEIIGAGCVSVSFPDFFETIRKVVN